MSFFRGGDLYYICANLDGFLQVMSHTTAKSQNTMRCERMPWEESYQNLVR